MPTADAIYTVLVEECGASDDPSRRRHFVAVWPCDEHRFVGALGFGGKVWNPSRFSSTHRAPYVTCYPEDMTDERREKIDRANQRLDTMVVEEKRAGYVRSETDGRYVRAERDGGGG